MILDILKWNYVSTGTHVSNIILLLDVYSATLQGLRTFKLNLHGQFLNRESIVHMSVEFEICMVCWTESSDKLLIAIFTMIFSGKYIRR